MPSTEAVPTSRPDLFINQVVVCSCRTYCAVVVHSYGMHLHGKPKQVPLKHLGGVTDAKGSCVKGSCPPRNLCFYLSYGCCHGHDCNEHMDVQDKKGLLNMGPTWSPKNGFGTCCGFPVDGFENGGDSDGDSGGSAISPQGWLFNICNETSRCSHQPAFPLASWFIRLWQVSQKSTDFFL